LELWDTVNLLLGRMRSHGEHVKAIAQSREQQRGEEGLAWRVSWHDKRHQGQNIVLCTVMNDVRFRMDWLHQGCPYRQVLA
jgi:hypothetical protein